MEMSPEMFEKFMEILDMGNESVRKEAFKLMTECKDMKEFSREAKKRRDIELEKENRLALNKVNKVNKV